ncbi:MAG: GHKL domain-containing protein [Muribaculaceae bacterium]|nr:GHKL domain-containing protein [Muribaculaceae bacterium]
METRTIWMAVCLAAMAVVALWAFIRWKYVVPVRMIRRGMELLHAQETNNRLRLTGNPAADRVARLFNVLMERLQEQTVVNRRQNHLMSELIAASPMGVMMMDFDGRITDANAAALKFLDLDAASVTGRFLGDLPSELGTALAAIPVGKTTIRLSETEIYLCRRLEFVDSGFHRPFILIDNMADELRQVEKEAYGKVIRIMAHEVNNTLGGLKSLLELMADSAASDPLMGEALESGAESCTRLGAFVDSYAEVARVPVPEKRPVELDSYLSGLLPFLQSVTLGRAEVVVEPMERGLTVMADGALLERVLVNIVKNASEAMSSGSKGHIRISVAISRGEVTLTISNDGAPIPEGTQYSLFSPFYTTKPGGHGTGLALVAEILGRHAWKYSLSTGPDGLTRFRIRIP